MSSATPAHWDALSPFGRNCAFWTETHRLALSGLNGYPWQRRVRLEDLHDPDVLSAIYEFFGLPLPARRDLRSAARRPVNRKLAIKEQVTAAKRDALGAFDRWPSGYRAQLVELCGDMASALGYSV